MKITYIKLFKGYKGYLFIFILCIGLGLHLYTQHIVNQLRDESRTLLQFYANLLARIADSDVYEEADNYNLSFLFDEFIQKINFPIIYTDIQKQPLNWRNLDIDVNDKSEESLQKVQHLLDGMDRDIEPVMIKYQDTALGYLYYGDSLLVQQLQWLPYIEIGVIGFFILLGFFGYAHVKKSEQRYIWVGMAKETAHQLGTPISSLMGWLEIMRSGKKVQKRRLYGEMEKDLQRLKEVTTRFSQIGSKPDVKQTDVTDILKRSVEYIRRRAPQKDHKVVIREEYQKVPKVALNKGLFQWAVENIMKNALDAMDKDKAIIEVKLGCHFKGVYIEIQDNGRGVDERYRRRIFKPGYSTKQRGWGLGLSLAKRIIEEYHGGRLFVKESRLGWGMVIRIELS